MIKVGSAQSVEKLVADHAHAAVGEKILELEIEVIDPLVIDVHIAVKDSPSVGPEQAVPAIGGAAHNEDHVVHPPVSVRVDVQAAGNLASDSINGILQQGKFPAAALVVV